MSDRRTFDSSVPADGPRSLPFCAYPRARDVAQHGVQALPAVLPRVDFMEEEAFELVAATAAHYQALGYVYMVVEASNQWTGAACEVLGGVRVHFAPYQTRSTVHQSIEPLEGIVTSANGWLSNKDSGSMFYVIRLA
jgi:hypothetical protein